jgi:nucleoside-diphosphate-sugar epimerase
MTHTLLSFGHGYSARALTKLLQPKGWRVIGTTRSPEKAEELAAEGVEPLLWPSDDMKAAIAAADHILISAGPKDDNDPTLALVREQIVQKASALRWVGYLSTTGVYGNYDGAWVDEATPLNPTTKRGQARKRAEAEWSAIPELPLHIFRLAGIYGPGRGPFAKVLSGTARRIVKEGQVFSRIHVEDIAQILEASIASPNPGAAYNMCDDDPAPPQDVIAHAANLLGMPVPPAIAYEDAEFTPMARSFYAENKKVRNDRIKTELGVKLLYPTYREGLQGLLDQV